MFEDQNNGECKQKGIDTVKTSGVISEIWTGQFKGEKRVEQHTERRVDYCKKKRDEI